MAGEASRATQTIVGARLWWLIGGRAAVALLVLLAGVYWASGTFAASTGDSLQFIKPLILVVGLLSVIYSAAHLLSKNYTFQARVQFFADVLLVTWLVWITGAVRSPYTALYIVIISVASWFIGPRGALLPRLEAPRPSTHSLCCSCTGSRRQQMFRRKCRAPSAIQLMGLADVSFLVVGLLAAKLAERQRTADVQLAEATRSLADLRALHERIVESIRSGLITTDLEGRIFTFNAAAEEITGYEAEDVRGRNASMFFGEMTRQISDSMTAAAEGKVSPRFEVDSLTQSGFMLHLGFSIAPLFAESGETSGLVITFQDLTDVRVMEETARRQDRLAAVGRMAASIAHEIRNPLAAMRGSIQMLRSEMEEDSDHTQLMEIILRESDRLNKIVSDYLNYARPRPAEMTDVDVCDLIDETLKLLRNSPEITDGHRLTEELPGRTVDRERRRRTIEAGVLECCAQCFARDARRRRISSQHRTHRRRPRPHQFHRYRPRHDARASRAPLRTVHFHVRAAQGSVFQLFIKLSATIMVQLTFAAGREQERQLRLDCRAPECRWIFHLPMTIRK